jgi:hypothetical protein
MGVDVDAAQAVIEKLTHDELLLALNMMSMWFAKPLGNRPLSRVSTRCSAPMRDLDPMLTEHA